MKDSNTVNSRITRIQAGLWLASACWSIAGLFIGTFLLPGKDEEGTYWSGIDPVTASDAHSAYRLSAIILGVGLSVAGLHAWTAMKLSADSRRAARFSAILSYGYAALGTLGLALFLLNRNALALAVYAAISWIIAVLLWNSRKL